MEIKTVLRHLETRFGAVAWQPHRDGMSELILTILSHQTSDRNSGLAFDMLVHAIPDWQNMHALSVHELSAIIRVAGLARKKAEYILTTLDVVAQLDPPYNIDFLALMQPQDAIDWLTRIPGIGPKTAACVLLFGYGMPVAPVDTHIARVSQRLHLVTSRTAPRIQAELEVCVPDQLKYAFHLHMIQLGRELCHAQRPQCTHCPLWQWCPSATPKG